MSHIVGQTKEDCKREFEEQFIEGICRAQDADECKECIFEKCPIQLFKEEATKQ